MAYFRSEARWWGTALRHTWQRGKGWIIAYAVVALLWGWFNPVRVLLVIAAAAWLAWAVLKRAGVGSSLPQIERSRWERRHAKQLARIWPDLMARLGCGIRLPDGRVDLPRFATFRWQGSTLIMSIALPLGATREQLVTQAPAIAQNLGATSVRATPVPTGVELAVAYADALTAPFALPLPDAIDLRAVRLGIRDDGGAWTIRLEPHTLVAGASGSGKASLVWGLLRGIAPAIHSGLVEVHGVDLKGAMELGMGRSLLTRFASDAETAVQLLEDAVRAMRVRAHELSGTTRQHVASIASPHVVVLIDEMAALTAYQQDRELLRRANTAIALLCSQGRAVGYTVFACLQDPRKETLPARGLFTQTIGLRLHDAMETAMVLGEGMRGRAECPLIPATLPGVGYMVPNDGSEPIRVRAGSVTDSMIREAAERFPAPRQIPIKMPAPSSGTSTASPRPRRSRRSMRGEGE